MKLNTVKIRRGDGSCLINERDFDPGKHELYEAEKSESDEVEEPAGEGSSEEKKAAESEAPKRATVRRRPATKK